MKKVISLLLILSLLCSGCGWSRSASRRRILDYAAEHSDLLISCASEAEKLHRSLGYRKTQIELSDGKTVTVTAGGYKDPDDPVEELTVENAVLHDTIEALGGLIRVTADGVDFQCDGFGIAPSSQYNGLFYAFSGSCVDMPYYDGSMHFEISGDGFFGTMKGDDNTLYVVPLWDAFFYYEATF